MKKINFSLPLLLIIIFLSACSANSYTEGNFFFENKLEKLKIGLSKEEVQQLFGPPTAVSSFEDNIWYYIYETSTRNFKFLNKNIIDARVLIIIFHNQTLSSFEVKNQETRVNISYDNTKTRIDLKKTRPFDSYLSGFDGFK
ncbi:Outer membrane protein assembly factor BamE [Candidatus Hepatincolaceae symbiont of Richtersius coronifer]